MDVLLKMSYLKSRILRIRNLAQQTYQYFYSFSPSKFIYIIEQNLLLIFSKEMYSKIGVFFNYIPTRGKRRRGLRLTTIFPPCSHAISLYSANYFVITYLLIGLLYSNPMFTR